MIRTVTFEEMPGPMPVIDVRAPAEFMHGHIPGAQSLPLFSDEERARVGIAYKQVGREAAILLGFDVTGAKWSGFVRRALELAPRKKIALHCWRGGMRSAAEAASVPGRGRRRCAGESAALPDAPPRRDWTECDSRLR